MKKNEIISLFIKKNHLLNFKTGKIIYNSYTYEKIFLRFFLKIIYNSFLIIIL